MFEAGREYEFRILSGGIEIAFRAEVLEVDCHLIKFGRSLVKSDAIEIAVPYGRVFNTYSPEFIEADPKVSRLFTKPRCNYAGLAQAHANIVSTLASLTDEMQKGRTPKDAPR